MTPDDGVILSEATVRALIDDIFGALGFAAGERALLAEALIDGSRAGHPAHGVKRIPVYVDDFRDGMIEPAAVPVVTHEMAAAVVIDAHCCLGQVSTVFAIEEAAAKARQAGIGCATVHNGNDMACLGYYVVGPAREGRITLLMSNGAGGAASAPPFGSAAPFLSTNPITCGIPRAPGKPPLVIDLSTSVVSQGKVRTAANRGEAVPEGWLVDRDGRPVTDPARFFSTPREAALLPLGGVSSGYKGFLLSLMVEAFAGALAGVAMSSGAEPRRARRGLFVLVVDPDGFRGGSDFASKMEALVSALEALPGVGGSGGVRMPGVRRGDPPAEGIPVDGLTWARIATVLEELSLTGDYPKMDTVA